MVDLCPYISATKCPLHISSKNLLQSHNWSGQFCPIKFVNPLYGGPLKYKLHAKGLPGTPSSRLRPISGQKTTLTRNKIPLGPLVVEYFDMIKEDVSF